MRIEKVRFLNLNSLAGEWEIDFTNPRYVNDGIFAIVGPTGAGKSTLMDAICLALYGRTPRLKSINTAGNEIMTTNTGSCFSEVVFSTQKGRFRSTWNQRRSRGKAEGNLQPQQMEVADLTRGEGKILTEKIGESLAKVEEVTGMDYDRFVQSMMLAQGAFAQFLKATPKERSPILEEITGKKIYTEISIKVHERHSQEKNELKGLTDQMVNISLLSDEEKNEAQEVLAVQNQLLETKNNALQQLLVNKNWLLQLEQLRGSVAQLEESHRKALLTKEQFLPQLARLEKAELAAQLDAVFTTYQLKNEQKSLHIKQLAAVEESIPALQFAFRHSSEDHRSAKAALDQVKLIVANSQPQFQRVRLMDAELASQQSSLETEKKKEHELNQSIDGIKQEIQNLQQRLEYLQQQQASAQLYVQQHAEDKQIQNSIGAIELQYAQLLRQVEEKKRMEQLLAKLAQQQHQFHTEAPGLASRLESAQQQLITLKNEIVSNENEVKETTGGREEAEIRREVQLLQDKRLLVAKIKSLEEERTRLHDGQPCPLCGSEHHPFAEGHLPTDDEEVKLLKSLDLLLTTITTLHTTIKRLQQEQITREAAVSAAQNAVELHRQRTKEVEVRLQEAQQLLAKTQEEQSGIKSNLEELIRPFGFTSSEPENSREVREALSLRRVRWDEASAKIAESEVELNKLYSEMAAQQSVLKLKQQQSEELRHSIQENFSRFSALKADRTEVMGDKRVEEEEKRLATEQHQAEQHLEKSQTAANQAENNYNQAVQRLADMRTQLLDLEKEVNSARDVLMQQLQQSQFVDIDDLVRSRLDRVEMQELQQQRQYLEAEVARLSTLLAETFRRREEELAKNRTEETLESLNEQERLLKEEISGATNAIVQAGTQLKQDEFNRLKLGDLLEKIDGKKSIVNRWARLNQLIGSSDGSVFNKYAQGLTFEIVLNYANIQLQKLTDRYVMRRDPNEALAIQVVDTYQNNRIRSTENLSGGESFLFSLALALGLAQISSQNIKIETLFLDEGFGTLDEDTLEIALDALNSLHQEGRLIGIISHVAGLKESINTQIVVEKGPMGRSTLAGPGVRQVGEKM